MVFDLQSNPQIIIDPPINDIAVQDKRKWMAKTEHTPFME